MNTELQIAEPGAILPPPIGEPIDPDEGAPEAPEPAPEPSVAELTGPLAERWASAVAPVLSWLGQKAAAEMPDEHALARLVARCRPGQTNTSGAPDYEWRAAGVHTKVGGACKSLFHAAHARRVGTVGIDRLEALLVSEIMAAYRAAHARTASRSARRAEAAVLAEKHGRAMRQHLQALQAAVEGLVAAYTEAGQADEAAHARHAYLDPLLALREKITGERAARRTL